MDKPKRLPNAWVEAVKLYNTQHGGRWTIPRKPKDGEEPSKEYLAVKALMKTPGPATTAPTATRPRGRPRKTPAPSAAPTPAVSIAVEEIPTEDVAVPMGLKRKVRRSNDRTQPPSANTPKIKFSDADPTTVEADKPVDAPKARRGRPRKTLQTA